MKTCPEPQVPTPYHTEWDYAYLTSELQALRNTGEWHLAPHSYRSEAVLRNSQLTHQYYSVLMYMY